MIGKLNRGLARGIGSFAPGRLGNILHFIIWAMAAPIYAGIPVYLAVSLYGSSLGLTAEEMDNALYLIHNEKAQEFVLGKSEITRNLYTLLGLGIPLWAAFAARKVYSDKREESDRKKYTTHGTARFADEKELREAGLSGAGVVLGRKGELIEKPPKAEGHVLVVGGTGTGKSRGVAIPTLLRWPGSVIAIDVKGELTRLTSKARRKYGEVFVFDPEKDGDPYDPIIQARTVDGAQELARYLLPEQGGKDPFWTKAAQGILAAAALEAAHTGQRLQEVAERLCASSPKEIVDQLRESDIRAVRLLAAVAADTPEKTLGGIFAELRSRLLSLAADEGVERATAFSSWTPDTLETGASVYLRVSEHMLAQYRELWALIVGQIMRHLSRRPENADMPILILLDELPRLGELSGLVDALATLRSRNVHIVGIVQSMAQLDSIYGIDARKVIADNCRFKLVLGATDPETQRYFSDLAGQRTALAKSVSYSGESIFPGESRSEAGVPLVRPEEWAQLRKPILFAPRLHPAEVDQAFWDVDPELKQLA